MYVTLHDIPLGEMEMKSTHEGGRSNEPVNSSSSLK